MKKLCKVYSINDRNSVQKNLQSHNISSECKTKGPGVLNRIPDRIYWFIVYVKKGEYIVAREALKEMQKTDFEKDMELF